MVTHSSVLAWRIPMDREAWWATVHGVTKSRLQRSDHAQHSTEGFRESHGILQPRPKGMSREEITAEARTHFVPQISLAFWYIKLKKT